MMHIILLFKMSNQDAVSNMDNKSERNYKSVRMIIENKALNMKIIYTFRLMKI